ncbi:hypothetical protein C8R45DRAFT_1071019 [Mycena sanguinolenta]|nr:hypothetical protein C8R45DRAFT_1071019 [Mycena sanguinolenta]
MHTFSQILAFLKVYFGESLMDAQTTSQIFKQFEKTKGTTFNTEVKPRQLPKSKPVPVSARPLVEDFSTAAAPPVVKFSVSAQPAFVKVKAGCFGREVFITEEDDGDEEEITVTSYHYEPGNSSLVSSILVS